jgi:lysozyme
MKSSDDALKLIARYESCEMEAYQDTASVWTIGWGHTDGVCEGDTCTQAEADAWLAEDVIVAEDAVNRHVKVPLNQCMFDALVSWTYNLGEGNLSNSTMLKKLNRRDYVHAASEITRWFETPGSELGLLRRRLDEARLFLRDPLP